LSGTAQREKLHSTLEISLEKRAEALTRQLGSSKFIEKLREVFMEEQYKEYTIQVTTEHHNDNCRWKPICRIMYEGSRELVKQFDWDIGYNTPDQAEKLGLLISKKWIDARKPKV
jgi:hypothetical protein